MTSSATLESVLVDEMAGRSFIPTTSATATVAHERWWLKAAALAAVVAAIVVGVVVRDSADRPGGPAPQPTTPPTVTTPTTTSPTTSVFTTTTADARPSAAVTVSPDSHAVPVTRIWVTGLEVGAERDEFDIDPLAITAFQVDASLLTLDLRTGRATSIALDRTPRWTIQIPPDVGGRAPVDAAIGPDGNLYVAYQSASGEATFAAIGTIGERAGQLLDVWDTNLGPCDACIKFYLHADGIGIEYVDDPNTGDTIRTTPYVDPPIAGTFEPALLVNTGTAEPAPALPSGYADPSDPTYGTGQLRFFTVTNDDDQTPTGESWTLDALGTSTARTGGTYRTPDGIFWGPFSTTTDGSAMTTIMTSATGDSVATLVVGRPGGAIELYRPLDNSTLVAYTERDGIIYAVVSMSDWSSYALVALSPTVPSGASLEPAQRALLIEDWWNTRPADERLSTCNAVASQGIETVARNVADPLQEDLAYALPSDALQDDLAAFLATACPPP